MYTLASDGDVIGPFPTELSGALDDRLRAAGREFGTTTGRPRRCGWVDIPQLRYSALLNGFTEVNLTKLDVLTGDHPTSYITPLHALLTSLYSYTPVYIHI